MNETRTKYCSNCKELLAWEATSCDHCGAGRRPPPEASDTERNTRRHLPSIKRMAIGIAVIGLIVGGLVVKRHLDDKAATITRLEGERTTLNARVQELTAQKTEALRDALSLKRRAREKEAAVEYGEAERCAAEAEQLLEKVEQLGQQIEGAEQRLREVSDSLGALGVER